MEVANKQTIRYLEVTLSASYLRSLLKRAFIGIAWHAVVKKRKTGNHIPVLCYHRVLPELMEEESCPTWSILPEQFESQLKFLTEEGFNTLSLAEFDRMAKGLDPIIERSVLITFDDGFVENYAIVWEIARKYHIKINLFICPNYIGIMHPIIVGQDGYVAANSAPLKRSEEAVRHHITKFPQLWRPLNWQELREMQESGVPIGLHSHSHRNLALLKHEEIVDDIATGLAIMERELGQRPKYFALPYGWYDNYTSEVISILQSFRMELIFAANLGRARLPSTQPVIPRILISQQDDMVKFKQKLFGAYDYWEQTRQRKYAIIKFLRKSN